ncbi:hypothetical protein AB0K48_56855 [Nonomuraea sp. NPDC055795]
MVLVVPLPEPGQLQSVLAHHISPMPVALGCRSGVKSYVNGIGRPASTSGAKDLLASTLRVDSHVSYSVLTPTLSTIASMSFPLASIDVTASRLVHGLAARIFRNPVAFDVALRQEAILAVGVIFHLVAFLGGVSAVKKE